MYIRLHIDAFDFVWDKRFRKIKFSAKYVYFNKTNQYFWTLYL